MVAGAGDLKDEMRDEATDRAANTRAMLLDAQ